MLRHISHYIDWTMYQIARPAECAEVLRHLRAGALPNVEAVTRCLSKKNKENKSNL